MQKLEFDKQKLPLVPSPFPPVAPGHPKEKSKQGIHECLYVWLMGWPRGSTELYLYKVTRNLLRHCLHWHSVFPNQALIKGLKSTFSYLKPLSLQLVSSYGWKKKKKKKLFARETVKEVQWTYRSQGNLQAQWRDLFKSPCSGSPPFIVSSSCLGFLSIGFQKHMHCCWESNSTWCILWKNFCKHVVGL